MNQFATIIEFSTKSTDYRMTRSTREDKWRVERIKNDEVVGVYENMSLKNLDLDENAFIVKNEYPFDYISTSTVLEISNNL